MAKSPESRPALPYNPLVFSTPLRPAGAELPGASILAELPPPHALLIWDVLRAVLLFAGGAGERAWWPAAQVRAWEESILLDASLPGPVRSPLAVVAGQLADPAAADRGRISAACLALCDWAVEIAAPETTLAWAQAAALASPENPRLAWIAGKLFRKEGRFSEARHWLRRAVRLAVWTGDHETQARALIALGNICVYRASYPRARQLHSRALRIASRHRLREPRAMALHDLFMVAYGTRRFEEADQFGRKALHGYGPRHPQLMKLAHDIAYCWNERGYFLQAFKLGQRILPHFTRPSERLRVIGTFLRSLGGLGMEADFERCWREAEELLSKLEAEDTLANALLEIACGASGLGRQGLAAECVQRAREAAERLGESDVALKAEAMLGELNAGRSLQLVRHRNTAPLADSLVEEILGYLPDAGARAPISPHGGTTFREMVM